MICKINFWFKLFILELCLLFSSNGQVCNKTEEATKRWVLMRSPNYPSKFPASTHCKWRIIAPHTYRVKFQFNQLSLVEPDSDGLCNLQWIKIIDGMSRNSKRHVLCGKRSPGSLVSTGRVLQLVLYSKSAAKEQDYMGFEATYSITVDSPIFPVDTNKPEHVHISSDSNNEDTNRVPNLSRNVGATLYRLNSKKGFHFAGMKQSEQIETLNRLRNMGHDVSDNPRFKSNGEAVVKSSKKNIPTTPQSTTISILQNVRTKRRKGMSYTMKTILIVVAVIIVFLLLIVGMRKFESSAYCIKVQKRKSEEAKIASNVISSPNVTTISEVFARNKTFSSQSKNLSDKETTSTKSHPKRHHPNCKNYNTKKEKSEQCKQNKVKPHKRGERNSQNVRKLKNHRPSCKLYVSQQTATKVQTEIEKEKVLASETLVCYVKNPNKTITKKKSEKNVEKRLRKSRNEATPKNKSAVALPNRAKKSRKRSPQKTRNLNISENESSDSGHFSSPNGMKSQEN